MRNSYTAMKSFALLAAAILITACGNPKDTPLPKDIDKMDSIKESMQKLTEEERQLVASYTMRHTMGAKLGALFGGKEGPGIPDGMTLGKAIEEQRQFLAKQAAEEAAAKALKERLRAEREASMAKLREAVTVTLISKRMIPDYGHSGILMDERIEVAIGYKNNTDKDIAGIKGMLNIDDIFGKEITGFNIANDTTIKAGETATWKGGRSAKYGRMADQDKKFARTEESKYTVRWEPEVIVFKDGAKLTVPE